MTSKHASPLPKTSKKLTLLNEVTGCIGEQMDCCLSLSIADAAPNTGCVSALEYSVFEGTVSLKLVATHFDFRGQGLASILLAELQALYPEQEIMWGLMLVDGELQILGRNRAARRRRRSALG